MKETDIAARNNHIYKLYKITKSVTGKRQIITKKLKNNSGELCENDEEIKVR